MVNSHLQFRHTLDHGLFRNTFVDDLPGPIRLALPHDFRPWCEYYSRRAQSIYRSVLPGYALALSRERQHQVLLASVEKGGANNRLEFSRNVVPLQLKASPGPYPAQIIVPQGQTGAASNLNTPSSHANDTNGKSPQRQPVHGPDGPHFCICRGVLCHTYD